MSLRRLRRPWPWSGGSDGGTVTAELAVGLVGIALVLAAVLSFASVGREQIAVLDAAAAGARSAARGESATEVSRLATRLAGSGADVRVTREGRLVTVVVVKRVALRLPGSPQLTVAGRGTYPTEPQVGEG
ncbi:MAG: TadE family type IV pilus minor pilin [Actinomycetes bacterium]